MSAWVGTLALKRPQAKQASRTAEGSRPYQPQLGHTFRNRVLGLLLSCDLIWLENVAGCYELLVRGFLASLCR